MNKRLVSWPLAGKLDTRSDHRTVHAPNLWLVRNMIRLRSNEWAKRNGFSSVGTTVLGFSSHTMANIRKLTSCNGELMAVTKDSIWSHNTTRSGWIDRGHNILATNNAVDLTIATHSITDLVMKDQTTATVFDDAKCVDVATGGGAGTTCVVWQTGAPSVGIAFADSATETLSPPPSGAGAFTIASAKRPKVVRSPTFGYFLIFWVEESAVASVIKVKRVDSTTLIPSADQVVASDAMGTGTGTPWFDVQVRGNNDRVVVAYRANGPAVKALEWDPLTNTVSIAVATVVANDAAEKAIGWSDHDYVASPTPLLLTARNDAVEGVRVRVLNSTTLAQTASTTFQTSPGDVAAITGWWESGIHHARWTLSNADPGLTKIVGCRGGGVPADFMFIGALASKAFKVNGSYYVLISQPWETQPGYFLVAAREWSTGLQGYPPGIIARILHGRGHAVPPERNALSGAALITSTRAALGVGKVHFFHTDAGGNTVRRTPCYATVDFAGRIPEPIAWGKQVFFPGSVMRAFGGKNATEVGFNVHPEKPTGTVIAGGALSVGKYKYVITFTYRDDEGREWESWPSEASSDLTTSGGNLQITVTWKQPAALARHDTRAIQANIYRTQADRPEYFLAHTLDLTAAATQSYTDAETDASLALGRRLYSQGGTLINGAPPPCISAWFQGLRMLAIDAEDRTKVWASTEFQPGRGLGFHADLAVSLDADGPNTAGAAMDGRSVVFKRQAIYVLNGDWPNVLGKGDLPKSQRVAVGYGTEEPESVTVSPQGIWFKDPKKGICLLNRGLEVVPAGKPAQSSDSGDVVAAVMDEKHEHVRFITASGDSPIYDYLERQWIHWAMPSLGVLTSATIANSGTFYVGNATGEVFYYNPAVWSDTGFDYTPTLGLRLALAGLHGIQRIYRVMLGGYCADQARVRCYIGNDYENTADDLHDATAAPMSTVDAAPGTWAWTIRPKNGRSADALLVFDQVGTTEGVRWSMLGVEYGVMGGLARRLPKGSMK